jgi:hypothetical protein
VEVKLSEAMEVSSAMEPSTSGVTNEVTTTATTAEAPTNAEAAATPKQPVRRAVTNEMEHHDMFGSNYDNDDNDDSENHTVTTPGDLFSPRSAAAMALSAISQQHPSSLPMNLSMTTSMMATASAAAASGVFVSSRESTWSNSESANASANSSTSSTPFKATGTVSPTDYDYSSTDYSTQAATLIKKATIAKKGSKKAIAATKAQAEAPNMRYPVPNPLSHQQHQTPNHLPPPPPQHPSLHYANPMGPQGQSLPPPPPHHMQHHPHHHMQHHPHHMQHPNAPFLGPPPPPPSSGGPSAGNSNGNGNGNGNANSNPWGNCMPMPPMSYSMHPHQQQQHPQHQQQHHHGAPGMQFHPNMSMHQQQHMQKRQQHQQQLNNNQVCTDTWVNCLALHLYVRYSVRSL